MIPVLTLSHPAALLLLPLVALAVHLARRRRSTRWRAATALRAALLVLLILALSGPVIRVPASGTNVIFVIDQSRSISPAGRRAENAFVRDALRRMHLRDQAGVIVFGGRPLLDTPPVHRPALDDAGTAPDPDATNIGAALDLGLRVMPPSGPGRIVLLSSGAETVGDAASWARIAAASGVTVDAVPIITPAPAGVSVEDVVAPADVRAGEAYEVRAVLRASAPTVATVTVRRDGVPMRAERLLLPRGETAVRVQDSVPQSETIRYAVDVAAQGGSLSGPPDSSGSQSGHTVASESASEAGHGEALVVVRGKPRVLFVGDTVSPLPGWLKGQALEVETRSPDGVPALPAGFGGFGSVVLDDVAANDLSRSQQDAIRAFVGESGGGLVAIGGPHSFGVGGYAGTPLEEALPVSMDVRQREDVPTVAVVLLVDTSGSMEAFGTELAKEELAKEIASSVIDLLGARDQIGVITFDQDYRWLVPLTEARYRDRVLDQVARLQAGGGTIMYPALQEARRRLRTSPAKVRHVIVLSDGLTDPGEFHALALALARDKITLSTVAIGRDADIEFMHNLARWGGGRAYVAKDLFSIPEIFTTEAHIAVRSYLVEEPTHLVRGTAAPTLLGIAPPSVINGYVAALPKPAAEVALATERRDPILATWRYGLGRSVAFTSDDGLRWTAAWTGWRDVARFWSQAVRWTLRSDDAGMFIETADDSERRLGHAVLEARHPEGGPWDGLLIGGSVVTPDGGRIEINADQTAPGRYEASWAAPVTGTYTIMLSARDGHGVVAIRTVGLVVASSPDLRMRGGNLPLLARLTEITGGALLHSPADAFRQGRGSGTREAWPPLAGLALAALLVEVTIRRIPALAQHAGAAAASILRRGGRDTEHRRTVLRENQAYDAADRWAPEAARQAEDDALRAASMQHAARLYIARLRGGKVPRN